MSPQFVDFDGDGHLDIVAGTFDGSPHVALGSAAGFLAPTHVLDAWGQRIVANQYWGYEEGEWLQTERCDPERGKVPAGHLTSAVAHDWDGDGDLDLLLGDYAGGRLYLRRNDGKPGAPAFATRNEPVKAGKEPLEVAQHLMTLRLVDWDRDGRVDVLVGTGGDSYGEGAGGGVYLFRNVGRDGTTELARAEVLVAAGDKGGSDPTRPDTGLYPDVADVDGDGDLDLVVGGYSHWTPPARKLSKAESARADHLEVEVAALEEEKQTLLDRVYAETEEERDEAEQRQWREDVQRLAAVDKELATLEDELHALRPVPKSEPFVWLYENLAKSPDSTAKRDP